MGLDFIEWMFQYIGGLVVRVAEKRFRRSLSIGDGGKEVLGLIICILIIVLVLFLWGVIENVFN